jgi:hypothetical protein
MCYLNRTYHVLPTAPQQQLGHNLDMVYLALRSFVGGGVAGVVFLIKAGEYKLVLGLGKVCSFRGNPLSS